MGFFGFIVGLGKLGFGGNFGWVKSLGFVNFGGFI